MISTFNTYKYYTIYTIFTVWKNKMANVDMSVKNKNVFGK